MMTTFVYIITFAVIFLLLGRSQLEFEMTDPEELEKVTTLMKTVPKE